MNIHLLGERGFEDEGVWDRFVRSSPDGTVFHLSAWKRVVEDVFRHRPHYLIAAEGSVVRAVLPLGEGLVVDPFAGAGSTLAAAEAVGYESLGVEKDRFYFDMACGAIPKLARFSANGSD